MKVALGLPTRGSGVEAHQHCLQQLMRSEPSWEPFKLVGCPNLDTARAIITSAALEWAADVLLFIDSDITFAVETCREIVRQALETQAVVGCVYGRKESGQPPIVAFDGDLTCYAGGALVEVISVGFGLTAVHASVFSTIDLPDMVVQGKFAQKVKPWYTSDIRRWGELEPDDGAFCRHAREAGVKIFADTRHRVGHVGDKTFFLEDAQQLPRPKTFVMSATRTR